MDTLQKGDKETKHICNSCTEEKILRCKATRQIYNLGEEVFFVCSYVTPPYILRGTIIGVNYIHESELQTKLGIQEKTAKDYTPGLYYRIAYKNQGVSIEQSINEEKISRDLKFS